MCMSFLPQSVLDEKIGIVPAKSLMTFYAEKISTLEKGVAKAVCEHTLSRLQSRIVSFEEQVNPASYTQYAYLTTTRIKQLSIRPFTIWTTIHYPIWDPILALSSMP